MNNKNKLNKIIFFIVVLGVKGVFILTKSVASAFDLLGVLVLVLSMFYNLPQILYLITGFLILQKGFLSLVS